LAGARVTDRELTARVDRTVTAALRRNDSTLLVDGFGAHVSRLRGQASWDSRDEMLSLAAFFDCARRLGEDPAALLGPSSRGGPDWFVETFDGFAKRTDVTLAAFGWSVVETPEGPEYRFAWPRWDPPKRRPTEA